MSDLLSHSDRLMQQEVESQQAAPLPRAELELLAVHVASQAIRQAVWSGRYRQGLIIHPSDIPRLEALVRQVGGGVGLSVRDRRGRRRRSPLLHPRDCDCDGCGP